MLAAKHWLLWCVTVLKECGIVNANVGMLGEFSESERGVQVKLPTLFLSTTAKILLEKVQIKRCSLNIHLTKKLNKKDERHNLCRVSYTFPYLW